jgi:UDP-3-O-[3-hydroxymyristoyl] glucosamine N-acyltransferase
VKSFTLAQIAQELQVKLQGDGNKLICGLAPLQTAKSEQLAFLDNPKYRKFLQTTTAGAVIVHPSEVAHCPVDALISEQPYVTYAKAAQLFTFTANLAPGIHSTATVGQACEIAATASIGPGVVLANGVKIGQRTIIHPGCVIGENAILGDDCILWPNVTLYHGVQIANRVIIHSGAVIGSDGFGMANEKGQWLKIPQLGTVILHDDVEIGANTTIDRGALGDTIIGKGVKLDNQIQIGHNVEIGEHTAIAACSGVSGSTKIGKYCMISGMVGFTGHFEIADKVIITGMSMVSKGIKEPGIYSSGTALEDHKSWRKNAVRFRQLDEMFKKINRLEATIAKLTGEDSSDKDA